jgi:hypothetical protein
MASVPIMSRQSRPIQRRANVTFQLDVKIPMLNRDFRGMKISQDNQIVLISNAFGGHSMSFVETTLKCTNCNKIFIFSAREHELRASQGFPNVPGLCITCRKARKTRSTQEDNSIKTAGHSDKYFR